MTNKINLGLSIPNTLYIGTTEVDKAYLGTDEVWSSFTPVGDPWGPYTLTAVSGALWAITTSLSAGDELFDDFGITNMAGTIGTSFKLTFDTQANRDAFASACDSFTVGTVQLDPANGVTNSTSSFLWNNSNGIAAAAEFDGATQADGYYEEASTGPVETILDTWSTTSASHPSWNSGNSWWTTFTSATDGSWSSTGTNSGTYIVIDAGSQLRNDRFRFGPATGNLTGNERVRVTFTPDNNPAETYSIEGAPLGSDTTFYWTSDWSNADIEEGGNFGWNASDAVTIEVYTTTATDLDHSYIEKNTIGAEPSATDTAVTPSWEFQTGTKNDLFNQASNNLRLQGSSIRMIFKIDTAETFSSSSDYVANVINPVYSLTINGTPVTGTPVANTFGSTGIALDFPQGSSAAASALWDSFTAGDQLVFTIDYDN